ncbi:MAG: hypothetical protein M3P49_10335 [Actinomycetota bacterium]|nr:hypothetical protein [Actinomycetota bacterium]
MRQVTNGKVYDTDKAELLHRYESEEDGLYGIEEGLYVTAKGAYFIAGSGGAGTIYAARESSTNSSGGSGIQVLDRDAAIEWLERHGGTEALLEHFADALEEA